MDCLWITLADPDPAINGQLIYSKGLIESAHAAGAQLCVVGLTRSEKSLLPPDQPGLTWRLEEEQRLSRRERWMSPLPDVGLHGAFPRMRQTLDEAIGARRWDAVIFDSICAGWALPNVLRRRQTFSRLVYLAHNHEITVARRIAEAARGARRLVKEIDALKVVRLERRLAAHADLVTANTPQDCRTFAAEAGPTPVVYLPPGYGGPQVPFRTIDGATPRRAVIVGSFDWPPKRISLERFLAAATPILARAGVELQVVGAVESDYLGSLRERYPSVTFVGPVDDVRPYMAAARIALVPDLLGGFKLKGLDYVFNRIPILAMRIALPGMPLQDGRSIGLFDSHQALAEGVVALIDDLDNLNTRQAAAFEACVRRFDWARIGRHLLAHIKRVTASTARGGAAARASSAGSIRAPVAAGR